MIPPAQLPAPAQAFIKQHFPQQTITYAKKEFDNMRVQYEAYLDDGTEVKFTAKGDWDKVDCKFKPVPAVLVPAPIMTVVQSQFGGQPIVKIDKERYGYDIELANDLELKFTKTGQLMSVDD